MKKLSINTEIEYEIIRIINNFLKECFELIERLLDEMEDKND